MNIVKATLNDVPAIWEILKQAIEQRRLEGSNQWQNGYPNEQTVINDINKGYGHVVILNEEIIAYAAIIVGVEPAYNTIIGKWLSNGDYIVVHRVAIHNSKKRKGVATQLIQLIEELAIQQKVPSIKLDTNFDNMPMLKILDKLNYTYCGEIFYDGAPRKAYEKMLL